MTPALKLLVWLATAILAWTPGVSRTRERVAQVDADAREMLAVAFDDTEPPAYDGPAGRARTALITSAVGSQESAFIPRIQAGQCRKYECDSTDMGGGRVYFAAACYLQIHADDGGGIVLTKDGGWTHAANRPKWNPDSDLGHVYRNEDIVGNTRACFFVGMHMVRRSIRSGGRLCMYTSELGPCPKADHRQALADRWFAAHPPPVIDSDVLVH